MDTNIIVVQNIETEVSFEDTFKSSGLKKVLKEVIPFIQDFKSKTGKNIYLVGGALRNLLNHRIVKDLDFATNASTEEIREFYPVKEVGVHFGVNLVTFQDKTYEVARFRTESSFSNNRKDVKIEFAETLLEDIKRRDFTINTLALTTMGKGDIPVIVCTKQAYSDIRTSILRFQGDAAERIQEDPLRILRGLRIALQNELYVDDTILLEITSKIYTLDLLSKERIYDEMTKIIKAISDVRIHPNLINLFEIVFIKLFSMVDFSSVLSREKVNPYADSLNYNQNSKYHSYTLDKHVLTALSLYNVTRHDTTLRHAFSLALFLHDLGKPYVAKENKKTGFTNYIGHEKVSAELATLFLKHFRCPKKEIYIITELIRNHTKELTKNENNLILSNSLKHINIYDLSLLKLCDDYAKKPIGVTNSAVLRVNSILRIDDTEKTIYNGFEKLKTSLGGKLIKSHKDLCFDIVPVLKERLPDNKLKEALLEVTNWVIKQKRNNEKDIMSFIKCKY